MTVVVVVVVVIVNVCGDLHGDGDHGNPAESAGIPLAWKLMLRGSRGGGKICCGTPVGMEKTYTGLSRKCSCI